MFNPQNQNNAPTIGLLFSYVFEGVRNYNERLPKDRKEKIIKNIRSKFAPVFHKNHNFSRFRYLLRSLKAIDLETILYQNASDDLKNSDVFKQVAFPSNDDILNHFVKFNEQYQYFRPIDNEAKNAFIIYFKGAKLIADYIECNNDPSDSLVVLHAYKMLVLFGCVDEVQSSPFKKVMHYMSQFYSESNHPVHDALVHPIPVNVPPIKDRAGWQQLISCYKSGIHYFQEAQKIEALLGRAPRTKKEADEISSKLLYARAEEYPELASVCKEYKISEDIFNKCLEIDKNCKKFENIPDLFVNGENFNVPGYYLVKLPIEDPRRYILGAITHCCQSIGGHAEQCVIDGIRRPNNGFYVLLKGSTGIPPLVHGKIDYEHFKIVGQGYAYLTRHGNLTIDSWEFLNELDGKIATILLPQLGHYIQDTSILRVTIGHGGKTPAALLEHRINKPEEMIEGTAYGDAESQSLLCYTASAQEQIDELIEVVMHCNPDFQLNSKLASMIVSSQQLSCFDDFSRIKSLFEQKNRYISLLIDCVFSNPEGLLLALKSMSEKQKMIFLNDRDCLNKILQHSLFGNRFENRHLYKIDQSRMKEILPYLPEEIQDFYYYAVNHYETIDKAWRCLSDRHIFKFEETFKEIAPAYRILFLEYAVSKSETPYLIPAHYRNASTIFSWLKLLPNQDHSRYLNNILDGHQLATWFYEGCEGFGELNSLSSDQKKIIYLEVSNIAEKANKKSEIIIKNIQYTIISKEWKLFGFGFWGGSYISLNHGERKKVPANVKLQWDVIEQANTHKIPYVIALNKVINIGREAHNAHYHSKIIRMARDDSTNEYYETFFKDYEERYGSSMESEDSNPDNIDSPTL